MKFNNKLSNHMGLKNMLIIYMIIR